jgi:hypothetical protein
MALKDENCEVVKPRKGHLREAEEGKPISMMADRSISPSGINEEENKMIGLFGMIDPEKEYKDYYGL